MTDLVTDLVTVETITYSPSRDPETGRYYDDVDKLFPPYSRNPPRVQCGCMAGRFIITRQKFVSHCRSDTHKTWLASDFPRQLQQSKEREKENKELKIELELTKQHKTRLETEQRALLQKNELITQQLGIAEAERDIANRKLEEIRENIKSVHSAMEHLNATSADCFVRDDNITA